MKFLSNVLFGSAATKAPVAHQLAKVAAKPMLDAVQKHPRVSFVNKGPAPEKATMVVVKQRKQKAQVHLVNPRLDKPRVQQLDKLHQMMLGEVGAPDGGNLSELLNMHKEVLHQGLYESGVRDSVKYKKLKGAFVAGSGNSIRQAIDKSIQMPRTGSGQGPRSTLAVKGDGWLDNVHQLLGTGVDGTQGQRNAAYLMGALKGRKAPIFAHSQGNLTMENTARTLEPSKPEVRDLTVHGIGSPLVKNYGPNSKRTTGWLDPIQLVRSAASLFFGQVIPDSQNRVGGGHGADGYLKRIKAAKASHNRD